MNNIKLVGRKDEVNRMNNEYRKVLRGHCVAVFVEGQSGYGKTTFIEKTSSKMRHMGFFVGGKYRQVEKQPYRGFSEAFNSIAQMIIENDDIEFWRKAIKNILGDKSDFITTIAPEFQLILGKTMRTEEPYERCDKHEVYVIIEKFICALTLKGTPVVLVLDDLQWADNDSLHLLEYLISHIKERPVMFILSYRNNELAHDSFLRENSKTFDSSHTVIKLGALDYSSVKKILKVSFRKTINNREKFQEMIYESSKGNPLYLMSLIRLIKLDHILKKDRNSNVWMWESEVVEELCNSGNILEFLNKIYIKCSEKEKMIVKYAACIGFCFNVSMLLEVLGKNGYIGSLSGLVRKGIFHKVTELETCFFHDKFYEIVRENLILEEREYISTVIAEYVSIYTKELPTDYYNVGKSTITEGDKKIEIAQYNLKSGEQAMGGVAYESARHYFQSGINILSDAVWESNYDLTKKLFMNKVKCDYLLGRVEEAHKGFEILEENINEDYGRIELIIEKVMLYASDEAYHKAIGIGIEGLKLLGERIPIDPSDSDFFNEEKAIEKRLEDKSILEFINIDDAKDWRIMLITKLLVLINTSANEVNQRLFMYICIKATNLSMSHGNTEFSPVAYAGYAAYLAGREYDCDKARGFEMLSIELANKKNNKSVQCITYFVLASFSSHWYSHISKSIAYLEESIEYGKMSGESIFVGYSFLLLCISKYVAGVPISEIKETCHQFSVHIEMYGLTKLHKNVELFEKYFSALESVNRETIKDVESGESVELLYRYLDIQYSYLMGDYDHAYKVIAQTSRRLKHEIGYILFEACLFYETLLIVALHSKEIDFGGKEKTRVGDNINKFEKWSKGSPQNFLHKYNLLQGEIERINGNVSKAMHYYDEGIDHAMENGFIQDAAIGNECAGKFYLELGCKRIAALYLNESYVCYSVWGAHKKAAQLYKAFGDMIIPIGVNKGYDKMKELEGKVILKQKMDRMVIGEGSVERAKKFLQLLSLYSGMERAVLILNKADKLYINLEKYSKSNNVNVCDFLLECRDNIHEDVIREAFRTGKSIRFDSSEQVESAKNNAYVQMYEPKTIWAIPILYKNAECGVFYLENREFGSEISEASWRNTKFLCTQLDCISDYLIENTIQMEMPAAIKLSKRQLEILILMAEGANNNRICDILGLTINTVKAYAKQLYRKLDVATRTDAVEKARELEIII